MLARMPPIRTVYAIEPLPVCIDEIKGHAPDHWAEMASATAVRRFDVDWDLYLKAWHAGALLVGTARKRSRLIGYLAMLYRKDPHSQGTVGAEAAFYYIEPCPARGLIQRNLIRHVTAYLFSHGVEYVRIRSKLNQTNGPILRNLGFEPDETLFVLVRK